MNRNSEHSINSNKRPKRMPRRTPCFRVSILSSIGLLLFAGSLVMAQTGLSVLRGTVNDQSGAVLPGAEISVTELATGIKVRTVITDSNGGFEIPDLKPGGYRLRAEKGGFRPYVADDLLLDSGQTRRLDIALQVGGTTEVVTVKAGAEVITTDTGTIGGGFDKDKFQFTPLVDVYPSPFAMFSTLPGIQGNGWDLRVSGQGRTQYSQGFDGVDNDLTGEQSNNFNFFQEASVVTVNATADSSRLGRYNLVSKRGQNQFHFMAYYKHFSSALNSRFFFEYPRKTPFIQHEWQGEASGPIFKDKTFFYFSWMQQRIPLGSFNRASVPTSKMRSGDFSESTARINDPLTGQPFADNRIPTARINPVSAKLQELYIPTPNLVGPNPFVNNFGWVHPFHYDFYRGDWPFARVDHHLTENNQLFGRWHRRKTPYVLVSNLPLLNWTRLRDHRQLVIGDTHVFSPSLINTFTFGRSTDFIQDGSEQAGVTPINGAEVIGQIGLQGVNPKGHKEAGFPTMSITGVQTLSTTIGGVKNDDSILSFEDTVTWTKGRHVWKFGGQYHAYRTFTGVVPNYGSFTFNGFFTGIGYADFLLGLPRTTSRVDPLVNRARNTKELGLFVMDTFKLTDKLTLDLGLRWDYYAIPVFEDGLMYNFNLKTGDVIVPQEALASISPLYPKTINVVTGDVKPDPDRKNFRPRVSFAYRIGSGNDFVVRGGYGAFTERIDYFQRVQGGGPFQISETYDNSIVNGQPILAFPNPFPSSLASARVASQSVTALPFETDNGSIHQFNLSVEKEIRQIGLRASYIGARSRGMNYSLNINKPRPSTTAFTDARRPYPQVVGVTEFRSDGEARYDSLQLEARRRAGFATFHAHWTWSNNVNNFSNTENPYDVTSNWSKDSATRKHYAVVNTTWDLPFGKSRKYLATAPAVVDTLLGGWQLQTVSYFGTGTFFSPGFSIFDVSNTNSQGGNPDRIGKGNLPRDQRTVEKWFDASAFKIPGCPDSKPVCTASERQNVGRFGNAGVNILEGPALNVHHLSLAKQFRLTERLSFNFSSSISNLFNHPHFNNPGNNISTPSVGLITATVPDYAPEKHAHRAIIFKGRFEF
jgi:Carboxypeptidase regulatory-like domain